LRNPRMLCAGGWGPHQNLRVVCKTPGITGTSAAQPLSKRPLSHQRQSIEQDYPDDAPDRIRSMLSTYAAFNADFVANGFGDYMNVDYVGHFHDRFAMLQKEDRDNLYEMLSWAGDVPGNLLNEAIDLLKKNGIPPSQKRAELARRIICESRMVAAAVDGESTVYALEKLLALVASLVPAGSPNLHPNGQMHVASPPTQPTSDTPLAGATDLAEPPIKSAPDQVSEVDLFARLTPIEAVDKYMAVKPKARGTATPDIASDQQRGRRKSKPKTWGESQRKQFRIAPFLFGKTTGGKPLAATTQEDLNAFYDVLTRLPSTHHKSPRHESMSLEKICEEGEARLALAEERGLEVNFTLGLDVGTMNRHFANLKRLCIWLASKTPMNALDFSDYILEEDDLDERTERDAYTVEQGHELFQLGIWTGGAGVELKQRLTATPFGEIWHDAAYWVAMIVWYTGMRREEACKLLVSDIGEEGGVPFFQIKKTRAGGVKNSRSVRNVPICEELQRLGFVRYVVAMRTAGEDYLFPEIQPGKSSRTLGDVWFKNIWLQIKPHLKLVKAGQAVHSCRHMVSTELKMLNTFEEHRSDLLGQKSGSENADRYADASRLSVLKRIVDQIPIVTGHLPSPIAIHLLPEDMRCPRPTREGFGKRLRA
ncbi:integrase, partial [Novosphingobium lubricantis]